MGNVLVSPFPLEGEFKAKPMALPKEIERVSGIGLSGIVRPGQDKKGSRF
jgi:hypothetical protein